MTDQEVLELLNKIDNGYKPTEEEKEELSGIENIAWRRVEKIPDSIVSLTDLQSLDLSFARISTLPDSIVNLTGLQSLDLSSTEISTLQDSIVNLTGLQHLDLSHTKISTLPDSIVNLTGLQHLDLSHTKISTLPDGIVNLTGLRSLYLSYTWISTLPDSIVNLTGLQILNLSSTQISALPDSIVNLTGLQILDLSSTQISALPDSIVNLAGLQSLFLSSTQISALPDSIGNLSCLQRLYLSSTPISALPDSIGNLSCLQILDLSSTQISTLPDSIGELPELKELVLEGLTISELPESLLSLYLGYKDRKYSFWRKEPGIYIRGLRLQNQPIEIFSQSRELIIGYYESIKSQSILPINECKVVFLGDGGVGKSLIIDRLMNDGGVSKDFNGESTPGIHISSKKYLIWNEEIELHFWDFGGQAIMHSMHRLFLTNRTLYVVVTNARDNKANEQAWYWIRNIKSFANGAPILLLVNQKDQNPSANINENGLRKEYPELKQVRIVSALKDTKEVFDTDIRDTLCQIVANMETVHTPFSLSWLSLMNDLQGMREDYITTDVFYKMCSLDHVDTDKRILDQIIGWYQDLGVCFYSKAHPVSAQYMVLKPRWLLNALYILIFNGRKYAKNGIISETDIYTLICERVPDDAVKKVWNDIIYKTEEIQYIINVLLNYELIFRLDNAHFFIPMLCDENEPEIFEPFDSDGTFHVCFKYDYLPENVLHRLMVRHGYELKIDTVWRTGASFERKQCGWSSLVRIKDNCLDIYAKSDNQETHPVNSYLDMIRGSVYSTNDILGLQADEFIAYRSAGKEDNFKYKKLMGIIKANHQEIYSEVFEEYINIGEILGAIKSPDKLADDEEDSRIAALLDSLMNALQKLQNNSTYYDASENKCNSYIRDLLEMRGYSCKDQTLHGISPTSKSDGELDILIRDKDRDADLSIFEALKLKAFGKKEQDYLIKHLKKLLDNYNPEGLSTLFLVSYVSWNKDRFKDLTNVYRECVMMNVDTKFRFTGSRMIDSYNSSFIRCFPVSYDCGGIKMNVYHIIVRVA